MEKRSPKLPLHKEKIQSSCVKKFPDAFTCQDDRSNQKLLSNGGPKEKHEARLSRKSDVLSKSRNKQFEDVTVIKMHQNDAYEGHVKHLLGEEFATGKQSNKNKKASKEQNQSSGSRFLDRSQKNHKKGSKSSTKMDQKPTNQAEDRCLQENQLALWSDKMSSDKEKLAAMLDEICQQIYQEPIGEDVQRNSSPSKRDQLNEANMQLLQLRAKVFLDQIYVRNYNSENGSGSRSKQFSDAADILKLNMDLFLKLLRDPYFLFVKKIRSIQLLTRNSITKKLLLESKSNHLYLKSQVKTREKDFDNFTLGKLKCQSVCSPKGNFTSQASSRTLLLKPKSKVNGNPKDVQCDCASLQCHQCFKNKKQRRSAYVSVKDIKQTLKQAVGVSKTKQNKSSPSTNLIKWAHNKDSLKDDEPVRSRLLPSAKKSEQNVKPVDKASSIPRNALSTETVSKKIESSLIGRRKKKQLDVSTEAKHQRSQRLKDVDLDGTLPKDEAPGAMGKGYSSHDKKDSRSFSFYENESHDSTHKGYYLCSYLQAANCSTLQDGKQKSVAHLRSTSQMGEVLSRSDFRMLNDPNRVEFKPSIEDNLYAGPQELEDMCSFTSDNNCSGGKSNLEANEVVPLGNTKTLLMLYEPVKADNAGDEKITGKIKAAQKNKHKRTGDWNRPIRSFLDPSSPAGVRKLQTDDSIEHQGEKTSPISVLESISPDEISSPTISLSEAAKSQVQTCHEHIDGSSPVPSPKDPRVKLNACTDRKDALYLYVKNEISGLNFDQLILKGNLPETMIKVSKDDGMALLAVQLNCDLKLLFDCIHEVISGLYRFHFGQVQRLLFLKPNRIVPLKESFIDEVVKEAQFYLLPTRGEPHIDELVGEDLAMSKSWFDLRCDTEDILIQLAEDVLLDSITDTILEAQM